MTMQIVQVNIQHSEVVRALLKKVVREGWIELVATQALLVSALCDEGKWQGFEFLFSSGSLTKLH